MATCPAESRLQDLLAERLSAAEANVLEQHLIACAGCQLRLEQLTSKANNPPPRKPPEAGAPLEPSPAFLRQLESSVLRELIAPAGSPGRSCHDAPPSSADAALAGGGAALPTVPGYEVLAEVGRGGMGVVYLARQHGLNRLVALKMILAGAHASPRARALFRAEAEVVAKLQHPHIVQIHAIGECDGLPFLCLEYLPGGNLARHLAGKPQPVRDTAEMVQALAQAVAFAHERGIIHRDLKPANILRATDGTLKVSDFGLATRLQDDRTTHASSAVVGTPSYMAPEQALGARTAHGPAVDVYALGAILYEMLTGHPPFTGESTLETLVQVAHADPLPPRRLRPQIPRDLETICLKCLEKDPHRRYVGAGALGDDLRRYRAGEPIVSRPLGRLGRAAKWARRRPAVATLLATIVLGTIVSFGLLTWLWDQAASNAADERSARLQVERLSAGVWLDRGATLCRNGDVGEGLLAYARALDLAEHVGDADLERVARINLASWPSQLVRHRASFGHNSWAYAIAYSPDGKTIMTAGDDGLLKIWDAATGQEGMPPLKHAYPVFSIAVHPDGRSVLTACGSLDGKQGEARLWDLDTRKCVVLAHPSELLNVAFDADGKRFLTACAEHVQLWDHAHVWIADTARPTATLKHRDHKVTAVLFSPDGRTVLTGGTDRTARLWDAATGQPRGLPLAHGGKGTISALAFRSPDGDIALTADDEGRVQLWQMATHEPCGRVLLQPGPVRAAAFSPDGQVLAVGCALRDPGPKQSLVGGEVRFWQVPLGQPMFALKHPAGVRALAFSPDGRLLLTGAVDGKARLYNAAAGALVGKPLVHEGTVVAVAFSPKGPPTILTASAGGDKYAAARLWDLPPTPSPGRVLASDQAIMSVLFLPGGAELLCAGTRNPTIQRAVLATGRVSPTPLVQESGIGRLALSADGRLLLSGGTDGKARLWDLPSATLRHTLVNPAQASPKSVSAVALSPSGDTCWTGSSLTGDIRRWQTATGKMVGPVLPYRGRLVAMHTLEGGAIAWLESDAQTIRMRRWAEAYGVVTVWQRPGRIDEAAFGADGAQILTADWNEGAHLRDARTGKQLRSVLAHDGYRVHALAFSPDGNLLLTAGRDKTARLWDAATGKPLGPPLPHSNLVFAAAFSPDGRWIVTGGEINVARIWDVPTPMHGTAAQVRRQMEALTGLELDADGAAQELDPATLQQRRQRLGLN